MAPAYEDVGCDVVAVVSARDEAACVELTQSRGVDAISVHSPPFLHLRHVEMAIEAGKSVLCDKPFGIDATEASAMTRMAEDAETIHMINFEFRFLPIRKQLESIIAGGVIGTPHQLLWRNISSLARHPLRPFGWVFERARGGGWLRAWGSHAIDSAAVLFGPVHACDAAFFRALPSRPDREGESHDVTAEDGFAVRLASESGVHIEITSSSSSSATLPETMTVVGSDGVVTIINDLTLDIARHDRPVERVVEDESIAVPRALRLLTSAFHEAHRTRTPVEPGFRAGLACARVLDDLTALADGTAT
jgi:predicted dehydrogenase